MTFRLPKAIAIPLIVHAILFVLVVVGILPRSIVPWWTVALVAWALWADPKVSTIFFATAIPLFIAIPVTANFDNFNMWRLVSVAIAARWLFTNGHLHLTWQAIRSWPSRFKKMPVATGLVVLVVLAVLSVGVAPDHAAALKRIIYFANAALVPLVVFALARDDRQWRHTLVSGIAWSAVIVIIAGIVQLISTYLIDVYTFMVVWGEGIQLRQFGSQWSSIAVHQGNTWLAYYGDQLSLRVFSLFPDSHSFPVYVLLALSDIAAIALEPVWNAGGTLWTRLGTRARVSVLWLVTGLLLAVLSGTRGIWAAAILIVPLMLATLWVMPMNRTSFFFSLSTNASAIAIPGKR